VMSHRKRTIPEGRLWRIHHSLTERLLQLCFEFELLDSFPSDGRMRRPQTLFSILLEDTVNRISNEVRPSPGLAR
jgi:hypothetical protein